MLVDRLSKPCNVIFQRQSKGMYREMKNINRDMAKKFLVKEKRVGKMLAILTGLFFVVYMPGIILRAVSLIDLAMDSMRSCEKSY